MTDWGVAADPVIEVVRARMNDPLAPNKAIFLDQIIRIGALRLQTFASHPLCCSEVTCGLVGAYFAVERSAQPPHANGQNHHAYHLNLYGMDAKGKEVMLTHDHTLARGLGGADDLSNTMVMCLACNARKAKLESRACNGRRRAAGLDEVDVGENRVAKTLDHLNQMAQAKGLTPAAYRQACELAVLNNSQWGKTSVARQPHRVKLSKRLGMSLAALHFFKHEHNAMEMARRHITPRSVADRACLNPDPHPVPINMMPDSTVTGSPPGRARRRPGLG
jgi:hypothetical protein